MSSFRQWAVYATSLAAVGAVGGLVTAAFDYLVEKYVDQQICFKCGKPYRGLHCNCVPPRLCRKCDSVYSGRACDWCVARRL